MSDLLASHLIPLAADPITSALVIIAATFLHEDIAAVTVGILASQAVLDPIPSLAALIIGTASGDMLLHLTGRFAGNNIIVCRLMLKIRGKHVYAASLSVGLWTVAIARFIPGSRLPVYFGSGFLRLNPLACMIVIALTTCVWTPLLFWVSATTASFPDDLPEAMWLGAIICGLIWLIRLVLLRGGANTRSLGLPTES